MTTTGPPAAVDLAQEPDFWLGALFVSPSAARVRAGGRDQRVEPRVMEVLVVLTRNAGRTVSRDQLIDACWGGRIVSDDAVNRVLAQVRALARLMDPPPFVLETVPKVGVRLVAGEPASQLADATPAASAARTDGARFRSRPAALALAAAALVLLGAGGWLAWRWLGPTSSAQNGHVEVIQFEARSPEPAVRQLAGDISQDLVRLLSSGGVRTAQAPLPRDDARSDAELRVAGSVGLEAGKYLIAGQVIDRRTGVVLFAESLQRTPQEQARSPGDFTAAMAAVVHCTLKDRTLIRRPLTVDETSLYLNACAGVFFHDDPHRMLAVTRRLAKAAPDFAAGHAMHALAAALVATDPQNQGDTQALHAEAKAAAETAIRLNPRAAKAYCALAVNEGLWGNSLRQNLAAEEGYLLKALKYDPELPPARNEYASLLRLTGRVKQSLEFMKMSDIADPRQGDDPRTAMIMAAQGDLEGAAAKLDEMEAHDRVSQDGMRWTIAFWWEEPKTGLAKMRALAPGVHQNHLCFEAYLARVVAAGGGRLRGLPPSCQQGVDPNWRVRMLAREGDLDAAYELLQRPIPGGPVLFWYPEMRGFRADPRFWPLMKRTGLVDYWLKSDHWPDFCAEPGLPYDCKAKAREVAAAPASTGASAPARSAGR